MSAIRAPQLIKRRPSSYRQKKKKRPPSPQKRPRQLHCRRRRPELFSETRSPARCAHPPQQAAPATPSLPRSSAALRPTPAVSIRQVATVHEEIIPRRVRDRRRRAAVVEGGRARRPRREPPACRHASERAVGATAPITHLSVDRSAMYPTVWADGRTCGPRTRLTAF